MITSCSASSKYGEGFSCEKAFDGNKDTKWRTKGGDTVGAWIRINLVGEYRLTKMMVMGPQGMEHPAKDISLAFSNGVPVDFTLDDTKSWQTIDLVGIGNDILTNYANISVISVYHQGDVRFSELKVFGYASGMIKTT